MPQKILVVAQEQKCIGCRLCVLAALRYNKKFLGQKDSPIVIKGRPGSYKIQIDYGIQIKNVEKIAAICPRNCFDYIVEK